MRAARQGAAGTAPGRGEHQVSAPLSDCPCGQALLCQLRQVLAVRVRHGRPEVVAGHRLQVNRGRCSERQEIKAKRRSTFAANSQPAQPSSLQLFLCAGCSGGQPAWQLVCRLTCPSWRWKYRSMPLRKPSLPSTCSYSRTTSAPAEAWARRGSSRGCGRNVPRQCSDAWVLWHAGACRSQASEHGHKRRLTLLIHGQCVEVVHLDVGLGADGVRHGAWRHGRRI